MKEELGIHLGGSTTVNLTGYPGISTVRGGETVAVPMVGMLGQLPPRTTLYGQYIIGESRVYGRFTLARTPKGDTFPVCIQISDPGGEGTELVERGSGDTAKIPNAYFVQAVPRFANTPDEIWRPKQNRPGTR
jgi:serine/threonine-protein kinase